ncbi:MAG: hypothetical protein JOZ69_13160 [Myxococcales bacterium]|nr:hypothetical protein [Myxococcales bacterium]
MRPRWSDASALVGVLLLGASACGWDHLDALGSRPGDAGAVGAVDAQDPAADGAGIADVPDAVADAAEASPLACDDPSAPVRGWSFDTSTEGWSLLSDPRSRGTVVWTGTAGNPTRGALQVDVTPGAGQGAWLRYTTPLGDLTSRVVSAWVWLDLGPSPRFKVFVQTGMQFAWADGGPMFLPPRTWTCVSLSLDAPAYSQASYDPSAVVVLGFEMLGTVPFRLFVDGVRYD